MSMSLPRWRTALSPAYGAALALVTIQVGLGILFKAVQQKNVYTFSPTASITISEFLKLCLSTCFFYRECSRRHEAAQLNASSTASHSLIVEEKNGPSSNTSAEDLTTGREDLEEASVRTPSFTPMTPQDFLGYCRNEVPKATKFGFAQLALLYALINNSSFAVYKIADPGTVNLMRAGLTLITALVMLFTLKTKISKIQWAAIATQICGLIISQYSPDSGSAYPFSTYTVLMACTFMSAVSGVYNQKLCKSANASLHGDNMVLYASGATINFFIHVVLRVFKADEPGFFVGFGSWSACMLLASNVFIGLAITATYKYADAVIKCFSTTVSTAILLYISPIFFHVNFSFFALPGTLLVFTATWLYIIGSVPPSPPSANPSKENRSKSTSTLARFFPEGDNPYIGLLITTGLTIIIVTALTMSDLHMPPTTTPQAKVHHDGPLHVSPYTDINFWLSPQ